MLLVDDSEDLRHVLSLFLTSVGYECDGAGSAGEAMRFADSGVEYDVAVVDLVLCDKPGVSVCTEFSRRGLPVIVLTGLDQTIARRLCGPNVPVLVKPFDLCELGRTVSEQIGRQNKCRCPLSAERDHI